MPTSTFAAPIGSRYFEDYEPDAVHEFGPVVVEESEVLEFARRYDPQPFHTDPEAAFLMCRRLRKGEMPLEPLLLLVGAAQVADLELRDDLFDDFSLTPVRPAELAARLQHLFWRTGRGTRPELIEYGPLALNLETYQAAVNGSPLDLTYMEYELLKFLASHPGKVFTRETLLSRVWGYDYYGGARTVDVHIRRLRAKLGEEHAGLIHTVRSVGYRFGQSRWGV